MKPSSGGTAAALVFGVGLASVPPHRMPRFSRPVDSTVSLRDLASRGPPLIVFYRGGWCPLCNFRIHELATAFPVLSDQDLLAHRAFRVMWHVDDAELPVVAMTPV